MATELEEEVLSGRPANWPVEGEMHFRLVDQMLGNLDLTCDSGYVVRSYELGFPEVREVVNPSSLDDGTVDTTAYVGARSVTLDIVLRNTPDIAGRLAPTRSEAVMRDQVLKYMNPMRRPVLQFSEHGDDRVRALVLRGADSPISVSQPQFNEMSMSWRAPNGYIENLDTHVMQFTFGDVLDEEYHLHTNNQGTVPAFWTLTIDGDLEAPRLKIGNRELWLNYHIEPAGKVTIDSRTKTVRIGNQAVGYRYLDDKSDWFRIPIGEQVITFTHTAIPRDGYPYAKWEPGGSPSNNPNFTYWAANTSRNVTSTNLPNAATFPNLTALKQSTTVGDGHYTGPVFLDGDYVQIGDGSLAWYDPFGGTNGAWIAGYKPYANNPPLGKPPWIWSPAIDPDTGVPVTSVVTLTYRELFL